MNQLVTAAYTEVQAVSNKWHKLKKNTLSLEDVTDINTKSVNTDHNYPITHSGTINFFGQAI